MYLDHDDVLKVLEKHLRDDIDSHPCDTPEDIAYTQALVYVYEHIEKWIHDVKLPNWPVLFLWRILLMPFYILTFPLYFAYYLSERRKW